jgi:serine/threonine-protein kinase
VVLKALAKNPDNRYQRAADMRADLIRVQAGEAPKAPKVLALDDPTDPASWPEVTGRRRPKSGSQWLILRWLIAVAALAVLTITITVTVNALGDRSHSVRVPNVHGQTQQDAIAKLQDLGFEILGPNTKPDDSVPDGLVIDTEPRAGMALAGGDAITVNVSSGPEKRTIPSCAKLIANDCVRALATAGFHRVTLWPTDSADVAPNTVITTVPAAGQILAITSDVAVVVSKGPEARRVPDVSGQSIDQATANLRAAGFTIILRAPVDSPLPAGHVVSSDPLPGTALHGMSAITLKVSLGNQFTMPNLAGMTYLEIIPVLQVLGHDGPLLNGGEVPDTDDNRNRVVKQDPLPGSNVNRDGAITLNYGA